MTEVVVSPRWFGTHSKTGLEAQRYFGEMCSLYKESDGKLAGQFTQAATNFLTDYEQK